MNDFEKSLKVDGVVGKVKPGIAMQRKNTVKSSSKDNKSTSDLDERMNSAVYEALLNVKTANQEEEIRKLEYIYNLHYFMKDFDNQLNVLQENELRQREKDFYKR